MLEDSLLYREAKALSFRAYEDGSYAWFVAVALFFVNHALTSRDCFRITGNELAHDILARYVDNALSRTTWRGAAQVPEQPSQVITLFILNLTINLNVTSPKSSDQA